ncbi:hypothetical protein, partial [Fulvimonas soli]
TADGGRSWSIGCPMKKFGPRVWLVVVALVISNNAEAGKNVDVCQARRLGSQAVGKHVSFKGSVVSDGVHGTSVFPDLCADIGYPIAPMAAEDPSAVIRQAIMKVGSPGTTDKKILVEVDAVFAALQNGSVGLKIIRLKKLELTYNGNN